MFDDTGGYSFTNWTLTAGGTAQGEQRSLHMKKHTLEAGYGGSVTPRRMAYGVRAMAINVR